MGKIAFVFPGQGSQYVGMGRELADNYKEARDIFNIADNEMDFSVSELCFNGPEEKLKQTEFTQPALLTANIASLKVLEKEGIRPDFVAGHSLGEYAAIVAAESFSFDEAIKLVRARGEFMNSACPAGKGGMAAILGLSDKEVIDLCNEVNGKSIVEVANFNCPGQVVIAGEVAGVEEVAKMAKEKGAKRAIILPVSGPFHSSLMEDARRKLEEMLTSTPIADPKIPVITNTEAKEISSAEEIRNSLIKQVSNSVRWTESVEQLIAYGTKTFVEIGPGKVLSGLIKKVSKNANEKVEILNIEDVKSLENALAKLKECS